MKTNKKISAIEGFQAGIMLIMEKYYKQAISDNIKRAVARKKLSTSKKVAM